MINRDSWGHPYLTVRREILGLVKDGLLPENVGVARPKANFSVGKSSGVF